MSINFKSIKVCNFLSLGEVSADLSEQGYVLVSGRNEELGRVQSNGAGKSSIFDAIFWSITGETLRGCSDVINEHRKSEGCYVELSFTSGASEYKILRAKSRKEYGSTCYFYEDDVLLSDQIKKSQEMISQRIPSASSQVLGSIILLGQGLPYRFSSLSPSRRKDLLEEMSGSGTQIDKLKYQIDREEYEYNQKVSTLTQEIATSQGKISGLESAISTVTAQQSEVSRPEEVRGTIESFNQRILEETKLAENLKAEASGLQVSLENYLASESGLRDYIASQKAQLSQYKQELSSYRQGNCPTCGRPYEVTEETTSRIESLNKTIQELTATVSQMESKLQSMSILVRETRNTINEKNSKATAYEYHIKSYQQSIEKLNNDLAQADSLQEKKESMEKEIRELKVLIHESEDKKNDLLEYVDCILYIKRQLSRDFKGYMLQEVIKFLSSRSQQYGVQLFGEGNSVGVVLDGNKISITVNGRLYENLSGGERRRTDLAVQFALRDMLMTTSGFSCNLLVLDEAFDNLDSQGSESLVRLMTSEFSDIDSVFVVTHHSDITIPYDKSLTVVKGSDGISRIEIN